MKINIICDDPNDFISIIKLTRFLTGYGLKQAKDLVEEQFTRSLVCKQVITVDTTYTRKVVEEFLRSMMNHSHSLKLAFDKSGDNRTNRKGNHTFEMEDDMFAEEKIETIKNSLNTKRYRVKVEHHNGWIGIKIFNKKVRNETKNCNYS